MRLIQKMLSTKDVNVDNCEFSLAVYHDNHNFTKNYNPQTMIIIQPDDHQFSILTKQELVHAGDVANI